MEKNRAIKFRGKIKEKGISECWIEGSLVHITRTYKGEEDEQECDIYQIINEDGVGFFIDKDTIGQYTELKDKNGKEIYEGDILRFSVIATAIVEWNEKYSYFMVKPIQYYYFDSDVLGHALEYNNNIEIIGNIYDNPELLEV